MKKKNKEKSRLSVETALMWRITAMMLSFWLMAMCYLTLIVAQDQYERYVKDVDDYIEFRYNNGNLSWKDKYPIYEVFQYFAFGCHFPSINLPLYEDYMFFDSFDSWQYLFFDTISDSVDSSIVFCDSNREVIIGKDGYAYLTYKDEQEWFTNDGTVGYTSIDLNRTECGRAVMDEWREWNWVWDSHLVRLTGYFEGDEFVLVDASYFDKWEADDAIIVYNNMHSHAVKWYNDYDYLVGLNWIDWYDGEVSTDQELVNIYVTSLYTDKADSVTIDGEKWKLEDLTEAYLQNEILQLFYGYSSKEILDGVICGYEYPDGRKISQDTIQAEVKRYTKDSLWETVLIQSSVYLDKEGNICPYAIALRCQPMRVAMLLLAEVYVLSLLPIILLLFLIHRRIRKNLIKPYNHIMCHAGKDYAALPHTIRSRWKEVYELETGYVRTQETIRELRKEINQLNTALDYAKDAEENRKRMISNITHELKTPLAVIHSYAEGLQGGIAVEKQSQYLDVILEEAERMDGMVLEMLDFSRLEAGKVRLSSDYFFLGDLTKSVFEKLNPLAEEKSLQIEYIWTRDIQITADEGRIAQVITNLASNAIKYSPEGGKIWVYVYRHSNRSRLVVENQCPPIPEEDLKKIWDSFYRMDTSRTEKGTGLGLAIAKTIVELHGGTCAAQNTSTGVQFMIELP